MNTLRPEDLALVTDLYELTMAQSYFHEGKFEPATFSLFIRRYPRHRGYFVAAGLEDVLRYLEGLRFDAEAIDYLHRTGIFADDFLDYLRGVRFRGEVRAIPEGWLFFAEEPVLEVTAPIIEEQLVETYIINQVNLQSIIATKAARCVHAARGRALIDFSLRRTHGAEAGLKVARSSYIAGFSATSNVLAGKAYGISTSGTMAHSYVTSFEREIDAFHAFARSFPQSSVLLIDTYDTVAGALKAVEVAQEMASQGQQLKGVRIDSGDLLELARQVRRVLDEAGLHDVKIIGSGGLDEFDIEELSREDAPYDAYGVGTRLGVSADAPSSDMAYKLVRYADRPVLKLSTGKVSLPDQKQVYRFRSDGELHHDLVALRHEQIDEGEPVLQPFMQNGKITMPLPSLDEIREGFLEEFECLGDRHKATYNPDSYQVLLSPGLEALKSRVEREIEEAEVEPVRHVS